jgi:TPR repeat protein
MEAYERAALLGHAGAQLNLGLFHWEGDGVPQDYVQAAKWVRMAADQEEAQGLFLMGAMLSGGLGMKQDHAGALSAYEAAVQKGWAPAMLNLGNMYLYGQGIPKDEMRATDYYRQGAELNHPPCVCNLAANFLLGRGVAKDPSEGMRLMRQAAILGYAVAQMNMAGCLAYGQDCRKSIPLSYAWATIASGASQKARDFLASNLAEITEAQVASGEKHIKALRDEMSATPKPVHPFVNDGT